MDNPRLYNIRIIKAYVDYLKSNYPAVDIDQILGEAGIHKNEINDLGYWFTQEQADKFYDAVVAATGNKEIAREAGRFSASSESYGTIRQYVFGFITPAAAYSAAARIGSILTMGGVNESRKIGPNCVEVISQPAQGVEEKPYQCENRMGMLESLALPFTGKYASIEHPECVHRGDSKCKYIIKWDKIPSLMWKRIRNYSLLFGLLAFALADWVYSGPYLLNLLWVFCCWLIAVSFYTLKLEKGELSRNVDLQSNTAEQLLREMNIRYNDALVIKEIGQAISMFLDIDRLLEFVVDLLKKRLSFDYVVVMLTDSDASDVEYVAGTAPTAEPADVCMQESDGARDHLSRLFRDVLKSREIVNVSDIDELDKNEQSDKYGFAQTLGLRSFACVPMMFKGEILGALVVGNTKLNHEPSQSDISLIVGIAQQIAISINNARSFQKLQYSEEKYRELVENANSIILRVDTEGRITFFNEFAQGLFGFSERDVLGRNVIGTIVPKGNPDINRFKQMMETASRNSVRYESVQSENVTRDGRKVWIAWTNRPIVDSQGEVIEILCVGIDVTAQKQAEMEKEKLENQLLRAQKMEAIGTLAGGVAHDLNNILSGIVSYPELLLMELPEGSPLRKPIMTIKKSGERAAAIVQDLLTLARRGVATPDILSLSAVVKEYLTSPEHENIRKNYPDVRFDVNLDEKILNTMCSKVHISKTIMNLVLNAVEAMPGGGVVRISTENRYVDRPISGYENVSEGEYAVFVIEDTGVGISPDDLSRIFEPFYTKKVMGRSGTGLGMAVVWGTVKDHDGYIEVRSEVGKGTRFDIYLPATRKEKVETEGSVTLDELRGDERILVVDDVDEQREIASQFLSLMGYSVEVAASGEAAVEYCRHDRPDLVLLDMIMDPGIDGLETYKRILKVNPGQKAIIVSGFSESERVKEALALGAGCYVRKPYAIEKLGQAIRAELNKK